MRITQKIIGVVGVMMAFMGCGSGHQPQQPIAEKFCLEESFKQRLEFELTETRQVTEGVHLTGSVEASPDRVVHFVSLIGGIITNTYFSLGDKVSKGQILAELKSAELSSLQAELANLASQIQVADNQLRSVRSMFDDGISSQKDLLEAQSELEILQAQIQRVMANLDLYSASAEKGVFQIKAPTSGIITAKSIAAGTQISADGDPLFTISDLSEVWVMVSVYATNINDVQEGMPVEIKTLSYPDEVFEGKIAAISQVYDQEARVLKARVVLPNTDFKLKAGMLVDVRASKPSDLEAVSVSSEAIVFDESQNFVVVYKSDCDLEIRKVEILSNSNGVTFISDGLEMGDKVVSQNQLLIYEQLKNFAN